MDSSVGSTIEKIKLQELNKEAKLKEKRELEATVASINRKLREALTLVEKSLKDQVDLGTRIDKLRSQVQIDRINRDTLLGQVDECKKELEELRRQSDEGISDVWHTRSSVCHAVQKLSDEFDIWPLLMKPMPVENVLQECPSTTKGQYLPCDDRLTEAMKRRDSLLAQRDRLLHEPDTSEEFVRSL